MESLDAILTSRSILFNKLTNLDDMEEFENFIGPFNPKEYVFVSSWTKSEEENLLLWNCYTDNKVGVRIGIPDMPFPLYPIDSKYIVTPGDHVENFKLLLPFEKALTQDYFIISFYYIQKDFEKEIIYLPKEELLKKYTEYAKKAHETSTNTVTLFSEELGKYKINTWKDQNEFRFVLNILPQSKMFYHPRHPLFVKTYNQGVLYHVNQRTKNQIEHFLLPLRDGIHLEMEIMLSPYGDSRDLGKVQKILEKHQLHPNQLINSKIRIQNKK